MKLFKCTKSEKRVNLSTITSFELNRYMGLWYEIARLDAPFERHMYNVTARYTLLADGKIRVENSGFRNGIRKTATGKAKPDPKAGNAALKVAFFLNFYAPYRILLLDPDYKYALVASSEKFLWILARTPEVENDILKPILDQAQNRGFDTSKLLFTQRKNHP